MIALARRLFRRRRPVLYIEHGLYKFRGTSGRVTVIGEAPIEGIDP